MKPSKAPGKKTDAAETGLQKIRSEKDMEIERSVSLRRKDGKSRQNRKGGGRASATNRRETRVGTSRNRIDCGETDVEAHPRRSPGGAFERVASRACGTKKGIGELSRTREDCGFPRTRKTACPQVAAKA